MLVNYGQSASLWENGEIMARGGLNPAAPKATAYAINDAKQVVGRSTVWYLQYHAFLWEDGVMYDLAELTGRDPEYALAINNCGEILLPNAPPYYGPGGVDFFVYHRDRGLRPIRGATGPTTGW